MCAMMEMCSTFYYLKNNLFFCFVWSTKQPQQDEERLFEMNEHIQHFTRVTNRMYIHKYFASS